MNRHERADLRREVYAEMSPRITLESAIERYLQVKPLGSKTKRDYKSTMVKNAAHLLNIPVDQITQQDIIAIYSDVCASGRTQSANKLFRVLRAVINFTGILSNAQTLTQNNPTRVLKAVGILKPCERRHRRLSPEQLPTFRRALSELNDTPALYYAALLVTGLRKEEARQARWSDIDFYAKTWTIPKTKNGRPHTVHLCRQLLEALKARYIGTYAEKNDLVFRGKRYDEPIEARDHEQWKERFSIDARPHDLRRTFASTVIELGYSEVAVKRLLNHRSGDVTFGYLHMSTRKLADITQAVADELERQALRSFVRIPTKQKA